MWQVRRVASEGSLPLRRLLACYLRSCCFLGQLHEDVFSEVTVASILSGTHPCVEGTWPTDMETEEAGHLPPALGLGKGNHAAEELSGGSQKEVCGWKQSNGDLGSRPGE